MAEENRSNHPAPPTKDEKPSTDRFMGWRDMVITPLVFFSIITIAGVGVWQLNRRVELGLFANTLVFFVLLVAITLIALKIIRTLFPLRDGIYSYDREPGACFIWNLMGFLCITVLAFQYHNLLIPIPFRKLFYQLMGAKLGKGMIIIGGRVLEPWRVTIEEGAVIGDDAGLAPHVLAGKSTLVLGSIHIKRGATIGARSVIMPGVTIGEDAVVNLMSVVPMNTRIGDNEVWGGNPAVRIR